MNAFSNNAPGHSRRTFLTLLAAGASASCNRRPGGSASGKKKVLTSFTILADMAREVAGGKVDVESITKPGAEIHGYEPTPGDIIRASGAQLILWNGLNLEVWFERFFERLNGVPSALLTEGIAPVAIAGGHTSGKPNPHAWMSPANALIYVENIRKALTTLQPEDAAAFTTNAAAYSDRIRAEDTALRAALDRVPQGQRWLATTEGAFSYLCRDYQLQELFLWPVNADGQGTPQQIQHAIEAIRANKVPVVFSESTVSDKPARELASSTGARYGGVLYVDSLTTADGPAPDYLSLLRTNARTIIAGFGL